MTTWPARILIYAYRWLVSPWLPAACRFEPSCSVYALEALRVHGLMRGGALVLRRLSSCHPWGRSGFDPVPLSRESIHSCSRKNPTSKTC